MKTDLVAHARNLPEHDGLDISLCFSAMRVGMNPEPSYRVMFRLCMENVSEESMRLIGRKWVLRDTAGRTRIIEAAEVFNQQPVLRPGDIFSYSGCQDFAPAPPASMELRFFGTDQANRPFMTPPLIFPRQSFTPPKD